MVVKLDLRIPGKHNKLKLEPVNKLRHYLVFSVASAFLITVIAVSLLGLWTLYSLHGEKADLQKQKITTQQNLEIMEKEFSRLNSEAAGINGKLDFMLGDVPTIEITTVLDTLIPKGVILESLNVTVGKAVFKGTAMNAEDVMLFVNKLSAAPFTLSVEVPSIKHTKLNRINICPFSIECKLRPMQEILATDVFPEAGDNNVSGDETL